jgi:hypothetical protein
MPPPDTRFRKRTPGFCQSRVSNYPEKLPPQTLYDCGIVVYNCPWRGMNVTCREGFV